MLPFICPVDHTQIPSNSIKYHQILLNPTIYSLGLPHLISSIMSPAQAQVKVEDQLGPTPRKTTRRPGEVQHPQEAGQIIGSKPSKNGDFMGFNPLVN